jgi:ATP-binding cassette subfamily F protein uup
VILVTHDRYFLDRVTNRILAFGRDGNGHGTLTALAGLDQWEAWATGQKGAGSARSAGKPAAKAAAKKRRLGFKEQRELDGIEARVQEAEAVRNGLRVESEHPDHASDAPKLVAILAALEAKQAEIDRLYARWEELERLAADAGA